MSFKITSIQIDQSLISSGKLFFIRHFNYFFKRNFTIKSTIVDYSQFCEKKIMSNESEFFCSNYNYTFISIKISFESWN